MIPGNEAKARYWEPLLAEFTTWFPAAPKGGKDYAVTIAEICLADRDLTTVPDWATYVVARASVDSGRVLFRYVRRSHGRRLFRCGDARVGRC